MATTDKKITFDKTKELAIIKASNELLEDVKRGLLERDSVDEGIILQLDNAKRENLIMAQTAYGASEQDVSGVQYHGPSVKEIKEYEKRLQKKGITDEQLHQKDISNGVVVGSKNTKKDTKKKETVNTAAKEEIPEKTRRKRRAKKEDEIVNAVVSDVVSKVTNEEKKVEIAESKPIEIGNESNKKNTNNTYNIEDYDLSSIPSYVQYDMIPLPSNGECYKHKKSRVPVAYLTAADENIITAPNMYRDGKTLDVILRRKILDKDFNVDELCTGDRDAILLWLRATAYGDDFPIVASNPDTGRQYNKTIKLSDFKYKDFNLKGDENGLFDYTTSNGDKIKVKFITNTEAKALQESIAKHATDKNKYDILKKCGEIKEIIDMYSISEKKEEDDMIKEDIGEIIEIIGDNFQMDFEDVVPNFITNQMIAYTYSINGNCDREFITNYIENMRIGEAIKYREFYNSNTPGVDLSITIEIPESEGGGSFDTFLRIQDTIFINY